MKFNFFLNSIKSIRINLIFFLTISLVSYSQIENSKRKIELLPPASAAIKKLEISMPLLDEDQRGVKKYKILKVSNRFDEHIADYSQDFIKIKELALKEKQLKRIQSWMIEKIEDTYININKDNQDCNFTNKWVKN